MKKFKVVFSTFSILLIICLLVGGVYVNYFLGQMDIDDVKNHLRLNVGDLAVLPGDEVDRNVLPEYNVTPGELLSNNDIINILLIGDDGEGRSKDTKRGGSDSIMIATIDMKHNKLKLTSFLRDTWVFLPGTDSKGRSYGWNRINTAYAYGDASFLMETIQYNFNIKLDKYVVVNFSLFREIIDKIGGIEITLSAKEAAYIRGRRLDEAGPNRKNAKEGLNNLDGWMALEFARARSNTAGPFTYKNNEGKEVSVSNDFARSARQRYVLDTLFKQMRNEDIGTIISIAELCIKSTRTNISIAELTKYIHSFASMRDKGVGDIAQMQIPYVYEDKKMPSGAQVLYLNPQNMQANAQRIKEFIFEE